MSRYYDQYGYGMPGVPGVAVTPGQPVGGGGAAINMPGRAQMGGQGDLPPWMRVPIWPPQLLLSTNKQVGHQTRDYGTGILNIAANTSTPRSISFDIPALIFQFNAAVVDTAGGPLPAGTDPLDTLTIGIEHSHGEQLLAGGARLGSAVCGSAARPRFVGGNGWVFNAGSTMIVTLTPLRPNLRIDVVVQVIEERGPTNLTGR